MANRKSTKIQTRISKTTQKIED